VDTTAFLALVGLALVDSTSVGTLVIPALMLAQPRVRARRVMLYLATISGFYLALGVVLLLSADALTEARGSLEGNQFVDWAQLVVGALMLAGSFWPGTPRAKQARARRESAGRPSRASRWVEAMTGDESGPSMVLGIALVAGLIEAASMLPYFGAVALIASSDLVLAERITVLAVYVLVMALPAVVLLGVRLTARNLLTPWLERLSAWLGGRVGGALWWVVGILGFLLLADAAGRLFGS